MKVLVLNCGSSSIKYQLIDMENENLMAKGYLEKIGLPDSFLTHTVNGEKHKIEQVIENHEEGIKLVLSQLTHPEYGVIKSFDEIGAIGHRLAHGGDKISEPTLIDENVINVLKEFTPLAPLHNPAEIVGVEACKKVLPDVPMVGVFDTAFNQTIPEKAYMYAIPYEYYEKYGIKRYGAHGISHQFITKAAAEKLGKKPEEINIISCHLGNGASLAAIEKGKCVDTSMGLTPLEGLVMGTRSGDVDPAVLQFVMKKENLSIDEMLNILNKKSGMLGVSGTTGDMRDLKALRDKGDKRAELALEMFSYRVRKYIGAYMAVLGHVDAIIFEGGIGEHNLDAVAKSVEGLEEFGIKLDRTNLEDECYEGIISLPDSRIPMYVIPTNEELEIAKETMELVK